MLFLHYTGVDLNERNIANAKRRFPKVDFQVGSVLSLSQKKRSADYLIGHDILEHLSLEGMDTVLTAAERIARRGLYFGFFRMDEVSEHEENRRAGHHENLLSAVRIREQMNQRYRSVELIHIARMLNDEYGQSFTHNRRAYSLIAQGHR